MQQPTRPSTQSKAWSQEKYILALEVNKSETSSPKFLQKKKKKNPDLATGYNKFTKCKTKVNNHYLIQSFKLQGLWPKKKKN